MSDSTPHQHTIDGELVWHYHRDGRRLHSHEAIDTEPRVDDSAVFKTLVAVWEQVQGLDHGLAELESDEQRGLAREVIIEIGRDLATLIHDLSTTMAASMPRLEGSSSDTRRLETMFGVFECKPSINRSQWDKDLPDQVMRLVLVSLGLRENSAASMASAIVKALPASLSWRVGKADGTGGGLRAYGLNPSDWCKEERVKVITFAGTREAVLRAIGIDQGEEPSD